MGQVLSIIWSWFCPKPKGGGSKGKVEFNNDNNPSHLINILDHPQPLITNHDDDDQVLNHDSTVKSSSSSSNDNTKKHDGNINGSSSYSSYSSSSSVSVSTNSKPNGKIRKGMYDSSQRILLVGEGDFSFSACLAIAFNTCASNIVATSLNPREFLVKNYNKFPTNEVELRSRGCLVMHDINARTMAKHPQLAMKKFDRIVFNFPHAGFVSYESSEHEIRRHQTLVRDFLKNAKKMIEEDGEIHVTHKSNPYFLKWDIEKLGTDEGLHPLESVNFKLSMFPGYHTKYGDGGDKNFYCNPSKTYKFALSPVS